MRRLESDDSGGRLYQLSDEQLITEIVQGQHDALTVLFDRFGKLMFAIADRILHNAAESEEVVQTVLLDIFRNAARFDVARGTVKVWLVQYAYHRSLQRRRHLEARRVYSTEHLDSVVEEILKCAPRKRFGLTPQEVSRLVQEALSLIKDQQRGVIEMIFFEGLTPEEIAERTGYAVGNVRHSLYRGLDKLRHHLETRPFRPPQETKKLRLEEEGGLANVRA